MKDEIMEIENVMDYAMDDSLPIIDRTVYCATAFEMIIAHHVSVERVEYMGIDGANVAAYALGNIIERSGKCDSGEAEVAVFMKSNAIEKTLFPGEEGCDE